MPSEHKPAHRPLARLDGVRYRFQTLELGGEDFHLRGLRDVQQCPTTIEDVEPLGISSATWPMFGVLWQSEELLSHLMVSEKAADKKVLELGCGLALASLVLRRRGIDVTATDMNPHASEFLHFNAELNDINTVRFGQAGWAEGTSSLGRFDLLVGSDVLYDHHSLMPLVNFVQGHISASGEVLIVDPGRGLTTKFIREMKAIGFVVDVQSTVYETLDGRSTSYWVLRFNR